MAEEGELTSIKDVSDGDLEYICSPCEKGGVKKEAIKNCPVCEENLCASCTQHHGFLKATQSHTLLDRNISVKASSLTMVMKCHYHPDREVEMYCGEHDMVYCTRCIAKEHRSCKDITCLEDLNISTNQQKELKRLKIDTLNIKTHLEDIERQTKTNIDNFDEQKRATISRIEKLVQSMIEYFQKLKHKALGTLEKEYYLGKENMETHMDQIRQARVKIQQECLQLKAGENLDVRKQIVLTKLIQHSVNNAIKIIEEMDTKRYQNLSFTENTELKSSVIAFTSLGSVQNVAESASPLPSKVYKVNSKQEINVQLKIEKNPLISDICQLPDGTVILADWNNERIKRLDENYHVKDFIDVVSLPRGICCTGNNEVAVKLWCNKVQLISIRKSLSKLREISVTGGGYWGIAYCAGELWVSTGGGVDLYSMSGALLKTISKDVNGQNIFRSYTSSMAVCGDTVIVTDFSDGAVCLRRDGTVKRELRDRRLTETSNVCVSTDGTVFIAGHNSDNIVMFDGDGNCLGELLVNQSSLKNPLSLCYDKKKHCVLVGDNSNKLVVLDVFT